MPPSLRSVCVPVTDSSQVGEARRVATAMAKELEFDGELLEKIRIVATEVANNLFKHGKDGKIFIRPLFDTAVMGIEILSVDKGPGMANVEACLRDGFSTAGTAGTGLGSIARLSSFFDVYSVLGSGTALMSRIWGKLPALQAKLDIGAICLAKAGETISGDNWSLFLEENRQLVAVADGLGHGPDAAHASNEAIRIFQENGKYGGPAILQTAHAALRSTRGAAMSIAEFDMHRRMILFAGVGNISGVIHDGTSTRSMVSHNGTLGAAASKYQEFVYPWPKGGLVILHSDGLMTRWHLEQYPGLVARHPSLVAAILHRDFERGRDDATVVVVREHAGQTK